MTHFTPTPSDCPLCPRLVAFRHENRAKFPSWWNDSVPSFGGLDSGLLIVGLAPGLRGANATGRPFTGDFAGDVLYPALLNVGLAEGSYESPRGEELQHPYKDALRLVNTRISNAVRCVPPENKPETNEIKTCNVFLQNEIVAMDKLRVILNLGNVSHAAVLRALGKKVGAYRFAHGAEHRLGKVILVNSYHTSRYNMNTGRLTQGMFEAVIAQVRALLN